MKVLKYQDLHGMFGFCRSTLYRMEKAGRFPKRIRLGSRSVGWNEDEVMAWLNTRPRGFTNVESPLQ